MPETDSKINYSLRPQKAMERRMMCDLLKILNPTFDMNSYGYVGMGAKYFSDFLLFHRELGIKKMTSIEADIDHKEKYDFNVPLKCIEMYYGYVNEYIDSYEGDDTPKFFWLDYDYSMNKSMLDDCNKLVNKLKSGDIFFVSFNSMLASKRKEETIIDYSKRVKKKFDKICEELGDYAPTTEILPINLVNYLERDKVFIDVFKNMIETQISKRNSGKMKLAFYQLGFFSYSDGADMATWGGMLVDEEDEKKLVTLMKDNSMPFLENMNFDRKAGSVFSEDIEPFDLRIPLLTYREFIALQREFPADDLSQIDIAGFKKNELDQLNKLYRYYSPYLEAGVQN